MYSSPTFESNKLSTGEGCVAASTNDQYTLKLLDSWGDSWSSPAWLEIIMDGGAISFKGFLTASREETYSLSLYQPIKTSSDNWKLKWETVPDDWKSASFPETDWTTVTLGAVTTTTTGPQYFRKTFTGLSLAAFELALKYRDGVVAYVNGVEVYRDYMPAGTPTPTTSATGSYLTASMHRIIRAGNLIPASSAVLAVELHWFTEAQTTVDFDAYLALFAGSMADGQCYVYPYEVLASGTLTSYTNAWNWGKIDCAQSSTTTGSLTFTFQGPAQYVNAIRFWPYTHQTYAPSAYTLSGGDGVSATYTPIITATGVVYTASTYAMKYSILNGNVYKSLKLDVTATSQGTIRIPEVQSMTCNLGNSNTIVFTPATTTAYAIYQEVSIRPLVDEFSGCTITPALPEGLVFDATTCSVSGKALAGLPLTTFSVSTTMGGGFTGTFQLTVNVCSGTVLDVWRIYKGDATTEGFSLQDVSTQQVIHSVAMNSGQMSNSESHTTLCATGTKVRITMEGGNNYWDAYSFVFIKAILSNDETEMIGRYHLDNILGLPQTYVFNAHYSITPVQNWFYKMSTVPSEWYGESTTDWSEGHSGTFTQPTNRIQLFKKTFSITSLASVSGFTLSLRYKYACVVYINNREVFRNGIVGDVSTSSVATNLYPDVIFRTISLPVKTIAIGSDPSVNYLQEGSNRIAIALIAKEDTQTTVDFDCALRLLGETSESRVFMHSNTAQNINGGAAYAFIGNHNSKNYASNCGSNYMHITFTDDRREWISSLVLQNDYADNTKNVKEFIVQARNENEDWTTIKAVSALQWSYAGQEKKVWLENNKPYNQYRLLNIGTGSSSQCEWILNRIDMFCDSTTIEPPQFTYPASTIIYKDIEMAELYPSSNYYSEFMINPDLPDGIVLDRETGTISGTTTSTTTGSTTYTVTARKYTGGSAQATLAISVEVCTGGKSLITMVTRTDSYPAEASYKLYKGKGTTGEVVSSIDHYPRANTLYYADFCVPHEIYTLEAIDSSASGWEMPAGFMLTVDLGTMRIEVGQVPASTASPVKVTTMFSSFLPFQINYDDWMVFKGTTAVPENWNTVDFDDSAWTKTKAAGIGASEAVTAYIRRSFTLSNKDNYQVLNVRMKYSGGVVVYFNGHKVARFNLEENYTPQSAAISYHNPDTFSQFHIILTTSGVNEGKNVIAFEIHNPPNQSVGSNIVFDATGVFGVNDCSVVVDSYLSITGTNPSSGTLEALLSLSPMEAVTLPNAAGTFFNYAVENLEGTKFNQWGFHSPFAAQTSAFSLYGTHTGAEERMSILALVDQPIKARERNQWNVPVGLASFNALRYEVDAASTPSLSINTFVSMYCKATGEGSCPGIDEYPPVGEGQISPGPCSYGFRGYSYRECANKALGEVKTDHCTYKVPLNLKYSEPRYDFILGTNVQSDEPTKDNLITKYYLDPSDKLPEGLEVDEVTGVIKGTPTKVSTLRQYKIFGENPVGVVSTTVNIGVRKGECRDDGYFPTTPVGDTYVFDCGLKGSYIGTQKRTCVLGKTNGEWEKPKGMCIPTWLIWVVVLAVIVVIVVLLVVVRNNQEKKRKQAQPKKSSKKSSKKTIEKKASAKVVKV